MEIIVFFKFINDNNNNIFSNLLIIIQIILFLILILSIIIKIIIFITQIIIFRNPRLKNIGSWQMTQDDWVLTQGKSIGSWCRTQQNWVQTQDPRPIGSASGAPKRIIIKIIIFIAQIIIFFILILWIIIKIIIFITQIIIFLRWILWFIRKILIFTIQMDPDARPNTQDPRLRLAPRAAPAPCVCSLECWRPGLASHNARCLQSGACSPTKTGADYFLPNHPFNAICILVKR